MSPRIRTALVLLVALLLAGYGVVAANTPATATPTMSTAHTATGVTATLTNFTADGRQATRFDVAGNPVDAHDGMIAEFGGTYYLYGTSYDCGYQWQQNKDFCGFKAYSSPDLEHWTDRGYVAAPRSCTYCFRPHVVYNQRTHDYVMWVNDQDATDNFRVYTAPSPVGPFTETAVPDLPSSTPCTADLGLFVDTDGTGYLTCSNAGWHIAVLRLTGDYLQPDGTYSVLGVTHVEAPSLFERDGTYYLAMSDPNCGYCSATGTSYATAPSPLGPWSGADSWTVGDGQLHVRGGLYGLSKEGTDWRDYTFSADVTPQPETTGSPVQAGWSVRMSAPDKGYLFLLHGTPTGDGKLDVLVRNGATVKSHTITLPFKVLAGEQHHVAVTAAGSTFTTSIDGTQVDSFSDTTYPAGGVGFREYNGANVESADFDNAEVVAADGTTLLSDDFSSTALSQWVPPLAGIKISDDSCGGQPSFVSQLRGADGTPVYLYASDLWDFHTNEALANYYWEPLRFAADGWIEPLRCDNSSVAIVGETAPTAPVAHQDQSSGDAAFAPQCTVTSDAGYGQTLTAGRTGVLRSIAVNVYKDGTEESRVLRNPPSAALRVTVTARGRSWSTDVPPDQVGWSARQLVLHPQLPVARGDTVRIGLSTDSPMGCYGVETDPTNPYDGGTATADGTALPETDLKFTTTVGGPEPPVPPVTPGAATSVLAPSGDLPVLPTGAARATVRVANLSTRPATVLVGVRASDGYAASAPRRLTIDVGATAALPVSVRRTTSQPPAEGHLVVTIGTGSVDVPLTPTDDVLRTATMGASSTHDGWNPDRANDGQVSAQGDYDAWNAGAGWNDADKGIWPDTLTAGWLAPVTLSRIVVHTLDAPTSAADVGLRDYDVQALVDGGWTTVASVRGNTAGTITSTFPSVRTTSVRLHITDSNDHGYSRVVEIEGFSR